MLPSKYPYVAGEVCYAVVAYFAQVVQRMVVGLPRACGARVSATIGQKNYRVKKSPTVVKDGP